MTRSPDGLSPDMVEDLDHRDDTADEGGTVVPLPSRTTLSALPVDPAATGTDGANSNGASSTGTRPRTRKNPAPAGTASTTDPTGEPPVTGFGGVDVSDYV